MAKEKKPNFLRSLAEGFAVGSGIPASLLPSSINEQRRRDDQRLQNELQLLQARQKPAEQPLIPDFGAGVPEGGIDLSLLGAAAAPQEQEPISFADEFNERMAAIDPAKVRPDKLPVHNRLAKLQSKINSRELRPDQKEQLAAQALQEAEQEHLEDTMIVEPTAASIAETHVLDMGNDVKLLMKDHGPEINDKLAQTKHTNETNLTIEKMKMEQQRQQAERDRIDSGRAQVEVKAKNRAEDFARVKADAVKEFEKEMSFEEREAAYDARWRRASPKTNPPRGWAAGQARRDEQTHIERAWRQHQMESSLPEQDPYDELDEMEVENPSLYQSEADAAKGRLIQRRAAELGEVDDEYDPSYEEIDEEIIANGIIERKRARKRKREERLAAEIESQRAASGIDASPLVQAAAGAVGAPPPMPSTEPTEGMARAAPQVIPPESGSRDSREKEARQAIAEQMGVGVSQVPEKEVKRLFAFEDVRKKDTPKAIKERVKATAEGRRFFQDLLPAEQQEVSRIAKPIMDDEDYENLNPGELALNPETGELRERPVVSDRAEQIRQLNRGKEAGSSPRGALWGKLMGTDFDVVSSQEQLDKVPPNTMYFDETADRWKYKGKEGEKYTTTKRERKTVGESMDEWADENLPGSLTEALIRAGIAAKPVGEKVEEAAGATFDVFGNYPQVARDAAMKVSMAAKGAATRLDDMTKEKTPLEKTAFDMAKRLLMESLKLDVKDAAKAAHPLAKHILSNLISE